jgi:hypothetical protein
LKSKNKEELSLKLLDDPKIPRGRQNPRRPHHSHKPLNIAADIGLKLRRPYCMRRRHHHLKGAPTNLNLKTENETLKRAGVLPLIRAEIHRASMTQRP